MDQKVSKDIKLRPMGIGLSLLYFGIPSAVLCFSVYYVMQKLNRNGVSPFANFYISLVIPLALMLVASLVAFKIEGNDFSWKTIARRFRLRKMTKKDWLWTLALFLATAIFQISLSFSSKWLMHFRLFAPPEFLIPAVDPRVEQHLVTDNFMGIALKGHWWIALVYFSALLFNIFGEEFWWRGYILPRQELVFKNWTWVVHGVLWTLFHVFWRWNLIVLFPVCLSLSYVVYRQKNTWIGIISHMAFNSVPLVALIIGIVG